MAKRKRKMTLFDVINSGQPIGLQVRQRIPSYQPTPELPVKKKLAKLFGRNKSATDRDPNAPLSAAEELELLRRELGAKPAEPVVERAPEPAEAEYDPTARWAERETTSHREREPAEVSREPIAETPRVPRKPIRVVLAEAWEKVSPIVEAGRAKCVAWSRSALSHSRTLVDSLRNVNQRHAATAATALAAVVVLGGSFYIGKVLLQRPDTNPALVDADGINTQPRPDVMDVDPNSGQAVANVSRSVPNVALERGAPQQPQTQATSTVFGGRNLDQNYVIAQSYYTQAEADAAVDVLLKYNIRAGVEKNLPGWSSGGRDFYSVVSYDGFSKLRDNAAYQAFLKTLGTISDRETDSTLPKRLDPRPYKYVRSAQ